MYPSLKISIGSSADMVSVNRVQNYKADTKSVQASGGTECAICHAGCSLLPPQYQAACHLACDLGVCR